MKKNSVRPVWGEYIQTMKECIKVFLFPYVSGYLGLFPAVGLLNTYFLIFAKAGGVGMEIPTYIIGVKELLTAFSLVLVSKVARRVSEKKIWYVLMFVSVFAVSYLALGQMFGVLWVISGLIAMTGLKTAYSLLAIHMFPVIQAGRYGGLRLSFLMFMLPIINVAVTIAFGYIAEIREVYVFYACAVMAMGSWMLTLDRYPRLSLVSRRKKYERQVKQERGDEAESTVSEQIYLPFKAKLMILLAVCHNGPNIVVTYVITTLYLFRYVEQDFSKFGLALGLLGLVALIGDQLQKILKKKEGNAFGVLVFSVLGIASCSILWGLNYSNASLCIVLIMIQRVLTPLWNTSAFLNLKYFTQDDEIYTHTVRNFMIYVRLAMGMGYLTSAVVFVNNESLYPLGLIILGSGHFITSAVIMWLLSRPFIAKIPETVMVE